MSSMPLPLENQPAHEYAAYFWDWAMGHPENVEQLDLRHPHIVIEDILLAKYECTLERAQVVSSVALQGILKANPDL